MEEMADHIKKTNQVLVKIQKQLEKIANKKDIDYGPDYGYDSREPDLGLGESDESESKFRLQ